MGLPADAHAKKTILQKPVTVGRTGPLSNPYVTGTPRSPSQQPFVAALPIAPSDFLCARFGNCPAIPTPCSRILYDASAHYIASIAWSNKPHRPTAVTTRMY
jgi:hypothetical protein